MDRDYFVHASSYVDDGVVIGAGTQVWHFCHLLGNVRIGRNCRIGQNVMIGPNVTIGDNVKIQNNVSVYQGVVLEDDVFCGPSMVFTNVNTPVLCVSPESSGRLPAHHRPPRASIGANATVVCGRTIGQFALVGAGSVVTRDVLPLALVYGNPARQRGWACECGLRLRLAGDVAACGECGRQYQRLGEQLVLGGGQQRVA